MLDGEDQEKETVRENQDSDKEVFDRKERPYIGGKGVAETQAVDHQEENLSIEVEQARINLRRAENELRRHRYWNTQSEAKAGFANLNPVAPNKGGADPQGSINGYRR